MLVPAEVWTVARSNQGNAVLVRPVGSEIAVPIIIGPMEAQSIMFGLAEQPTPRPMTHDLLISVIEHANSSVNRIEITELKKGTFYGRLVITQDGKDISIDSRVSDCIAVAVRVKCPIYIDELVVDEAGVSVHLEEGSKDIVLSRKSEITELKQKLESAINEENYEEAAKLRDQIQDLEKNP
jgi:bifunctional DNase/RNase